MNTILRFTFVYVKKKTDLKIFPSFVRVKTNKYTNYSFNLLIMYGSSYMFRHYIAILRERF
jgi:hypothetical protein